MNKKTFRYDPQTGKIYEACDYRGRGMIAAQLYGSQMPYNNLYRTRLANGQYRVVAMTHTEAGKASGDWKLAMVLER